MFKDRLLRLENESKDKDLKIIQLKQKVENIAEGNVKHDLVLLKALEATGNFIKTISNQQNEAEKRNTDMFKTFHDKIDSLSNLLLTPGQIRAPVYPEPRTPPSTEVHQDS